MRLEKPEHAVFAKKSQELEAIVCQIKLAAVKQGTCFVSNPETQLKPLSGVQTSYQAPRQPEQEWFDIPVVLIIILRIVVFVLCADNILVCLLFALCCISSFVLLTLDIKEFLHAD